MHNHELAAEELGRERVEYAAGFEHVERRHRIQAEALRVACGKAMEQGKLARGYQHGVASHTTKRERVYQKPRDGKETAVQENDTARPRVGHGDQHDHRIHQHAHHEDHSKEQALALVHHSIEGQLGQIHGLLPRGGT